MASARAAHSRRPSAHSVASDHSRLSLKHVGSSNDLDRTAPSSYTNAPSPAFPTSSYPYLPPYPVRRSTSISSTTSKLSLEPPLSAPPRAPLPPLPLTPSAISESTALAFAAAAVTPSALARRASALSIQSARSTTAPSLAEFGVVNPNHVHVQSASASAARSKRSRPRRPLRIDIPVPGVDASTGSGTGTGTSTLNSMGSFSSSAGPRHSYFDASVGGPKSPTGSVFSVSTSRSGRSAAESLREHVSGLLAAVPSIGSNSSSSSKNAAGAAVGVSEFGTLSIVSEGRETPQQTRPQSRSSLAHSESLSQLQSGSGELYEREHQHRYEQRRTHTHATTSFNAHAHAHRPPPLRLPDTNWTLHTHSESQSQESLTLSQPKTLVRPVPSQGLLTIEDLHSDPLLARAVTPITPPPRAPPPLANDGDTDIKSFSAGPSSGSSAAMNLYLSSSSSGQNSGRGYGNNDGGVLPTRRAPSPSPLELSSLARTLRAIRRSGAHSPLQALRTVSPGPAVHLHIDGEDNDMEAGNDSDIGIGLDRYRYDEGRNEDEYRNRSGDSGYAHGHGHEYDSDDYGAAIDAIGARLSMDLLNDFPATPLELPPGTRSNRDSSSGSGGANASGFLWPAPSPLSTTMKTVNTVESSVEEDKDEMRLVVKENTNMEDRNVNARFTGTLSTGPVTVARTLSQSLRKPLPPSPPREILEELERHPVPSSSKISARSSLASPPPAPPALTHPASSTTSSLASPPPKKQEEKSFSSVNSKALSSPKNTPRPPRNRGRGREFGGAVSPDISTMICSTPKPRASRSRGRLSSARPTRVESQSRSSRPSSVSRSRPSSNGHSIVSAELEDAYAGIVREGVEAGVYTSALEAYQDRDGIDAKSSSAVSEYGVAIARHAGGYDLGLGEVETEEGQDVVDVVDEDQIEENQESAEESDSDIDLHTPLPHILLRAGVLSPHSKVLNGGVAGGRDSVASNMTGVSIGSVMTKSGLFKDERDTVRRRQRHRDGKLLREGLGLTTGLGWSDSEDEDAPSALTSRLSKLALSRKSSLASLRSSTSRQSKNMAVVSSRLGLAKSTSAISRASSSASASAVSRTYAGRSSLPASTTGTLSNRSSSNASVALTGSPPLPSLSKSVSSSAFMERTAPSAYRRDKTPMTPSKDTASRLDRRGSSQDRDSLQASLSLAGQRSMSPSPVSGMTSSSSASLPFPPTPCDEPYTATASASAIGAATSSVDEFGVYFPGGSTIDTAGKTKSEAESAGSGTASANASARSKTPTAMRKPSFIATPSRARTLSSSSRSAPPSSFSAVRTESVTSADVPSVPALPKKTSISRLPASSSSPSTSPISATPRPLRLPALQQKKADNEKALQPGQPAPRTGSLLGYNRNLHDRQRAQAQAQTKQQQPHLTVRTAPVSPASPVHMTKSAASSPATSDFGAGRRTVSGLRPPAAGLRAPSPSRLSAPNAVSMVGKPRTGTGMVYRQTSLPASRGTSGIRRPGLI